METFAKYAIYSVSQKILHP